MGELVSVIIPSFKSDESLIIAINSVLNQTYQDIEVIVVDDNNPYSDARKITEKNMNRYMLDERVKYVKHEKNKNGAAARNTGIRLAQGEYLTFLDDDDVFMPLRIQKCVDELSTDTNYSAVYSDVELYEAGKEIGIVVAQKEGGFGENFLKMKVCSEQEAIFS